MHQTGVARETADRACFFEGEKFVEEGPLVRVLQQVEELPAPFELLSKVAGSVLKPAT